MMQSAIKVFFVFSFCVSLLACGNKDSVKADDGSNTVAAKNDFVILPIEGLSLIAKNDTELWIVGREKLISLNTTNLATKNTNDAVDETLNMPSTATRWLSVNGGITVTDQEAYDPTKEAHCSPEISAALEQSLVFFGPCEHTSLLTYVPLTKTENEAYAIGFTYSNYPHSNATDKIYGPITIGRLGNAVIALGNLQSGAAVLAINEKPPLKRLWAGNVKDGRLIAGNIVDNNGWFITSNGQIFHSNADSTEWILLSSIPIHLLQNVQLAFMDASTGYLFANERKALKTTDGGKSWKESDITVKGSPYKIVFSKEELVVLTTQGDLFLYRSDKDPLNIRIDSNFITDIAFVQDRLFILADKKLYFLSISEKSVVK